MKITEEYIMISRDLMPCSLVKFGYLPPRRRTVRSYISVNHNPISIAENLTKFTKRQGMRRQKNRNSLWECIMYFC